MDHGLKVRPMVLVDKFIDHDSQAKQIVESGLSARDIVAAGLAAFGIEAPGTVRPVQVVTGR
jgi:1-deoxy-D-xylulose-5-phosphate synthase